MNTTEVVTLVALVGIIITQIVTIVIRWKYR